ncbi:MAG: NRDE family protein [Desulfobacterales bacterium]|nr:NRDE family protein [Desulfobacterales bacterium]
MCLIAIAIASHPEYPLIIAANRDEFYSRPTAPLAYWEDHPDILAGRDLESRGTWLGVTRSGKIGAVTNFRDPAALTPWGKSRGQLVRDYLAADQSPGDYLAAVEAQKASYTGFNLVVGNTGEIWWYSNKNGGKIRLPAGIHGISNHLLNTPWPKVEAIRRKLHALIQGSRAIAPYSVLDLLFDRTVYPDHNLPDTGVGPECERRLSPVFVSSPNYGTRSSSVILVEASGRLVFCERTFSNDRGIPVAGNTRCFEIELPEQPGIQNVGE